MSTRDVARAYAVALGVPVVAAAIKLLVPALGQQSPFLIFFTSVLLAAWIGGFGPGLVATVVSSILVNALFLPPHGEIVLTGPRLLQTGVFFVEGLVVTALCSSRLAIIHERDRRVHTEQEARGAAEAAQRRSDFLANAGTALSSSLDYETTLASVARLAVPHIADWCAIQLVEDDGSVRTLVTAHQDPAKIALARDLESRFPYNPNADAGAPAVIRTGKPELIPEIPGELLEAVTTDPELLQLLRDLGLRSSMVAPLVARGRVLGAITFIAAESGRRFGPDDLQLAVSLANRAGLAVDNARLFRAAQQTAAEQTAILEHMSDGILLVDADGMAAYMNPAARRLFGVEDTGTGDHIETMFKSLDARLSDGSTVSLESSVLGRALAGKSLQNQERVLRRPDGSDAYVQISGAPVMLEDGTVLGAVGAFHDVTAERTLNSQKDDFLSAAAHDLKTPLAVIRGLAQTLERRARRLGLPDAANLVEGLQQIDGAVGRMNRLVNELLDVTRMEMGRPLDLNLAPMDLVALAHQVAREFQLSTDLHSITVEATQPELTGRWDEDRLERLISNLVLNAIKYSPSDGEIKVSVELDYAAGAPEAVLSVCDHGIGIPAADAPHVFERFYRAGNVDSRTPGTGIGLAGVRQIVNQHGGTISLETSEGQGSTFSVRLPLDGTASAVGEHVHAASS